MSEKVDRIKVSITMAPDAKEKLESMAKNSGVPYSFLLDVLIRNAHARGNTFVRTTPRKEGKA